MTLRHAFDTLGIDQGELNEHGFRYHHEILKRMKNPGEGTDAPGIKGLFRLSKQGQDRFRELLWPSSPPSGWRKQLLDAITTAADRSDRWLAARAPAT
jgi:hypothetical protein